MKKNKIMMHCLNCGAEIPADSAACPECGSDERTGWSQNTYLDGIDLGDDYDYEALREKEFSGKGPQSISVVQILIAVLVLCAFLLLLFRSYFG